MKVIRNRLHRVLFEREVLGKDFASWCEMDPSHFNRIKNGHVIPSLKTALRICELLGLEVEDLFSLESGAVKSGPARQPRGTDRARQATKEMNRWTA